MYLKIVLGVMNYNGSLGTPTLRGTSQLTACQHRQHEPFSTFDTLHHLIKTQVIFETLPRRPITPVIFETLPHRIVTLVTYETLTRRR